MFVTRLGVDEVLAVVIEGILVVDFNPFFLSSDVGVDDHLFGHLLGVEDGLEALLVFSDGGNSGQEVAITKVTLHDIMGSNCITVERTSLAVVFGGEVAGLDEFRQLAPSDLVLGHSGVLEDVVGVPEAVVGGLEGLAGGKVGIILALGKSGGVPDSLDSVVALPVGLSLSELVVDSLHFAFVLLESLGKAEQSEHCEGCSHLVEYLLIILTLFIFA